ncbi:MAG TPA: iron-containing alcohol dehydrogenase family protein [Pirellulaceae bacterium]|nr:iron-containing alcohol dehydrogenase family protein [Pirellulaceae bacterium]
MIGSTRVAIPTLVRVKTGALSRVGGYLARFHHKRVAVLQSAGLLPELSNSLRASMDAAGIESAIWNEVAENSFEQAVAMFTRLPRSVNAIVGLGGGKALDLAKYVAFLAKLPYFAIPTSLSNDGFCSPQASLTMDGKRRSLAATMPFGVVVDTSVCGHAPRVLSLSGVGDLAAKFTAIHDWKLAFHHAGVAVDDFAALLSDGAVHAFLARPILDEEGIRLLATSLLFNGIAMEVCGSSRPASGSEHLISHALDEISARPRLHGLQVGVATYLVSLLQQQQSAVIARLFEMTGFWDAIAQDPFSETEWLAAVRRAPLIKDDFFTVLSIRDALPAVTDAIQHDPWLARCFRN